MDRGARWATILGIAESDMTEHLSTHTLGPNVKSFKYQTQDVDLYLCYWCARHRWVQPTLMGTLSYFLLKLKIDFS